MKRLKRSVASAEEETLRAVLTQILLENANTRNQIAERLGVSPMTVCTAIGKLRDSNLITEHKEATSRGRRPLRIEPSERLHSGIMCLRATEATLVLCNQRNEVVERGVLPYNPNLPPEGNLAVLRQRWEACLHAHQKQDRGIGVGVILHSSVSSTESFTRQLREILYPNVIRRQEDLITEALSRPEYQRGALYLSVSDPMQACLVLRGRSTPLAPWQEKGERAWEGQVSAACETARLLSPNAVVVEGDRGDRAYQQIVNVLSSRFSSEVLAHVRLETAESLSIPERGMLWTLRRHYAGRVRLRSKLKQ